MPDNLESRLDQLGSALAGDVPGLPDGAPFVARVRARTRARSWRRIVVISGGGWSGGGGAGGCGAGGTIGRPGRVDHPDRPTARGIEVSPFTIAELRRCALAVDDPARAALPTVGSDSGASGDEQITADGVHSRRAIAALLAGR